MTEDTRDMAALRAAETEKYERCYSDRSSYAYAMGGARATDARADLRWAHELGCRTYLDIGCGRGEMLAHAKGIGFQLAHGTEIVPELCGTRKVADCHVMKCRVDQLTAQFPAPMQYDVISSFDVLEHLVRPDDEALLAFASVAARKAIILTANNRPSIDPDTGANLHINIREYADWDVLIRSILEPVGWAVEYLGERNYVSPTWRALLP